MFLLIHLFLLYFQWYFNFILIFFVIEGWFQFFIRILFLYLIVVKINQHFCWMIIVLNSRKLKFRYQNFLMWNLICYCYYFLFLEYRLYCGDCKDNSEVFWLVRNLNSNKYQFHCQLGSWCSVLRNIFYPTFHYIA